MSFIASNPISKSSGEIQPSRAQRTSTKVKPPLKNAQPKTLRTIPTKPIAVSALRENIQVT